MARRTIVWPYSLWGSVGASIRGIPSLPGIDQPRSVLHPVESAALPRRISDSRTCRFAKQDIVEYGQDCQNQSGLIPSSLMIGPHLSISDVSKVASSVGVEFTGDAAISPSRCLTGG